MDPLGIALGIVIAVVLVALSVYFAWRQRLMLQSLRFHVEMPTDQRRYLTQQCWRRYFGSFLLFILAIMMVGSLFLDFRPERGPDGEPDRGSVQFLTMYVMAMMLVLMVILIVAIIDFWATARYSFQQQKQLLQEHQRTLAADLMERKHRQAELN